MLSRDLSIVIITCNRRHMLQKCLDSVFDNIKRLSIEIVIVDNGSRDGTVAFARSAYPSVKIIENTKNLGVGPARNQGIALAKGRYILLFDDDAEVKGDALEKMVNYMDANPGIGICGGKLLSPNGELQYSCRGNPTPLTVLFRRTFLGKFYPGSKVLKSYLMLNYDHNEPKEVVWMIGACLMMRREIIDTLGLLKGYVYGPEDIEICLRAKKHGWKVAYFPYAEIIHHYARTSAKGINRYTLLQIREWAKFFLMRFRKGF